MRNAVVDVTTATADGHWDYEDIKRLCAYRDQLKTANALNAETIRTQQAAITELTEVLQDIALGARVMMEPVTPALRQCVHTYAKEVLRVAEAPLKVKS